MTRILGWFAEQLSQHRLVVYTAVVVTITLIVQLEGWGR